MYSTHDYALPGIAAGTGYPSVTRGEYVDRSVLERTFLRHTEFMRATGTPIWIGEFGPVYPTDRPLEPWRLELLRDQLEIYREHGAGWSLWTYKDIGLQGLVYAHPENPYFEPYPWGRRQFVAGLVRHILLAEPLVDHFARAFAGVGADEAAVLAASFRFDQCVERVELSDVLRSHLLGQAL